MSAPRAELLELLRAIKAEPEENTPKLALADWLQEQPGEADRARGEFLNQFVQNNLLARTDPAREDFGALVRLWNAHEREWAGLLKAAGFTVWATNHLFRWGLLFPVLDGTAAGVRRAERVAAAEEYAWVAGVAYRAAGPGSAPLLADSPLLDSLIALRLPPAEARDALLERLADAPRAAGLLDLDLGGGRYPAAVAALAAVARSPHLAGLRRLGLSRCAPGTSALGALANSAALRGLRALDLSGCETTGDAVRAFAAGTGLPALTELDLSNYGLAGVGDGLFIHLLANPHTGRLRKLNLGHNDIGEPGATALCVQPHMRNLTHLDLSANAVGNRAAGELANAPHLGSVEELILCNAGITNDGANALAKSPRLNNIRRLDLTRNRIGPRAVKALRARFGPAVLLS